MRYIYQLKDWPEFYWDHEQLMNLLAAVRHKQGLLLGKMSNLGFGLQSEASLEHLSSEILKSNEIEGELLDQTEVRSSVATRLGIDIGGVRPTSRHIDGIVEMMMDATRSWKEPLTEERLFAWHSALFPTGRSGPYRIMIGQWRDDSTGRMQVVSGAMGRERVHFEAPEAEMLPSEMDLFLFWINKAANLDPIITAGLAHLWFLTIHPFDDGNGRIARAITDYLLCRSESQSEKYYSMSVEIMKDRKSYYQVLERTQSQDSLNVTDWLHWFLTCLDRSLSSSLLSVSKIVTKHQFWHEHRHLHFNARQIKVLQMLHGNFFGKLTTSKWAKINSCSQDSALRDINDLVKKAVLCKSSAGGRSTSYELVTE